MQPCQTSFRRLAALVGRVAPVVVPVMLLLAGCRRDAIVDAALPQGEPALVANGLFSPDSVWTVFVSGSVPALGAAEPEPVRNAQVTLFEDGLPIETLAYQALVWPLFSGQTGAYRSNERRPVPGRTYRLEVEAPGFEPIVAEDAVPAEVPLLAATFADSVAYQDVIGPLAEITLTFQDPPDTANYYNIRVQTRTIDRDNGFAYSISYGFSVVSDLQDDFFGANPSDFRDDDALFKQLDDGVTFGDTFFDGQEQEVRLQVAGGSRHCGYAWPDTQEVCQVVVEFSSVSEAFYRYHRTLQLQREAIDNPFAEPVRIFSNVSNGFGIFAAYTTDLWIFERPLQDPDEDPTLPGSP